MANEHPLMMMELSKASETGEDPWKNDEKPRKFYENR